MIWIWSSTVKTKSSREKETSSWRKSAIWRKGTTSWWKRPRKRKRITSLKLGGVIIILLVSKYRFYVKRLITTTNWNKYTRKITLNNSTWDKSSRKGIRKRRRENSNLTSRELMLTRHLCSSRRTDSSNWLRIWNIKLIMRKRCTKNCKNILRARLPTNKPLILV